jgi:cell division protein FtsL
MTARITFLLLAALVICAMAVVASQHKARKLYVELQKDQAAAKQLEVEWGQLQLEQGTWSTHARVERIATSELDMRLPVAARIEVVQPPRAGGQP